MRILELEGILFQSYCLTLTLNRLLLASIQTHWIRIYARISKIKQKGKLCLLSESLIINFFSCLRKIKFNSLRYQDMMNSRRRTFGSRFEIIKSILFTSRPILKKLILTGLICTTVIILFAYLRQSP